MATDPLFTASFDLAGGDDYGDFIAGIRERLGNPRHVSHGRPVLPPVEPSSRRWFHVRLVTPSSALTLATRADNLCLAGFQGADGTWWELSRGTATFLPRRRGGRLIPGAASLGFAGSYRDLLAGGARDASNVDLGRRQMTEAVDALARLGHAPAATGAAAEQQRRVAKAAVAVLRLMVHEAARFLDVAAVVAGLMRPGAAAESGRIRRTCKSPDLDWAYWSDLLLRADSLPGSPAGMGESGPTDHLDTKRVASGAATVGILLFVNVDNGIKPKKALRLFHGNLCGTGRDGAGPDVTFLVSGEYIPAHRYVLAGKSAVFLRQFVGHRETGKRPPHVEIKDMDAATFTAMVHYIYTDTVPQLDVHHRRRQPGPEEEEAVAVMAHRLLAAAHRYGLDRLKVICQRKLESGAIYVDMAARTLAMAEQHNYGKLKDMCIDFIVGTPETLRAVLATEGYKHLEATCPSVLTQLLKSVHGRDV